MAATTCSNESIGALQTVRPALAPGSGTGFRTLRLVRPNGTDYLARGVVLPGLSKSTRELGSRTAYAALVLPATVLKPPSRLCQPIRVACCVRAKRTAMSA